MSIEKDQRIQQAADDSANRASEQHGADAIAVLTVALYQLLSRAVVKDDMPLDQANLVLGGIFQLVQADATSHPNITRQ